MQQHQQQQQQPQQQQPQQQAGADDASAAGAAAADASTRQRRARGAPQWRHKQAVIELLNELIDELDGIEAQIAHQAVEHIHAREVILTHGMSDTVLLFLKEASKKRDFQVGVGKKGGGLAWVADAGRWWLVRACEFVRFA